MKLTIDKEADALYLRLDDSEIVGSEQVSHGVVLDYSENDEVVGVEILWLSKRSPGFDYSSLHYETLSGGSDDDHSSADSDASNASTSSSVIG